MKQEVPREVQSPEAEKAKELAWLKDNLPAFWATAYGGYEEAGRGAIVIDTTGEGLSEDTPFYYVPQADFASQEDEVSQQMAGLITEYDPDRQLVAVFIRPGEEEYEFSMFQVGITEEALIDAAHSAGATNNVEHSGLPRGR